MKRSMKKLSSKKLVSVCLALLLALSSASALADMLQVTNCENWVSMRVEPDTSSDWVVRVPLGGLVDAQGYEGNFIYCTYNGYSGYILDTYLTDNIATPGAGAQEGSYRKIVNCKSSVTLRAQPSTSANALDSVPLGAFVTAFERTGSFTRCFYDGMTGYILTEYLGAPNTRHIINCKKYVTLRRSPSTSAPSEAQVPLGAEVEYLGEAKNGFSHCSYAGIEGFIITEYLGY